MIYLDNNATTACHPQVVAAMLPFFTQSFGNPSSAHQGGQAVSPAIRTARKSVQALIGAKSDTEIVFTSGGTESNNAAIRSALATQSGRTEIITTAVEHRAVLALGEHLAEAHGVTVHVIGVDDRGQLDMDAFRAALSDRVALLSVMWANNETGVIFPVAELARMAHQHGILVHSDVVQAAGKLPLALADAGVDMASLSAHKLHGPKGVGALYIKKGTPFQPLIWGGRQERARRAGTENTPGIVGMGVAAQLAGHGLDQDIPRIAQLRARLEGGIRQRIPATRIIGETSDRLANTAAIAFADLESEAIVTKLDQVGIAVSAGSACSSGSIEPSHVVRAMAVPDRLINGIVRFSLGHDTSEDQVDEVLERLPAIVTALRGPSWQE